LLWHQYRDLALALRDQGLADCFAARFALRNVELNVFDRRVTFAHLVVAQSQQSVEKVTKGFLLWHSKSFDPTKGHAPFSSLLKDQPSNQRKAMERLTLALGHVNEKIVRQVKWLESLAAQRPNVSKAERGEPLALNTIPENCEYPFWSSAQGRLVIPAEGMDLRIHAAVAFKAAKTYLTAIGHSEARDYCEPIRIFLQSYRLDTQVTEWPPAIERKKRGRG
jgi:hypothetical protein